MASTSLLTLHGAREIAGDVAERGEKEIAETVALQAASAVETILKQPAQQRLVLRKRHHAIADIARRQNAVLAAQPAGAAAVVRDRHHRDQIGEWDIEKRRFCAGATCCLRPRSSVESPVPPPTATMRTGRCVRQWEKMREREERPI